MDNKKYLRFSQLFFYKSVIFANLNEIRLNLNKKTPLLAINKPALKLAAIFLPQCV